MVGQVPLFLYLGNGKLPDNEKDVVLSLNCL